MCWHCSQLHYSASASVAVTRTQVQQLLIVMEITQFDRSFQSELWGHWYLFLSRVSSGRLTWISVKQMLANYSLQHAYDSTWIYTWRDFLLYHTKIRKIRNLQNYRGFSTGNSGGLAPLPLNWFFNTRWTLHSCSVHFPPAPLRFPLRSHQSHHHMLCVQQRCLVNYLFIVYKAYLFNCRVVWVKEG